MMSSPSLSHRRAHPLSMLVSFVFSMCLLFSGQDVEAAQKVLKSEPAEGKLPFGVKVLVDDGTCPTGQIKQMYRASAKEGRKKKCVAWKGAKSTQFLKREPGAGKVPAGAKILVDDGTCPAGKIKQVTGGGKSQGRKRACVERQ